jgi:hypothetical protein
MVFAFSLGLQPQARIKMRAVQHLVESLPGIGKIVNERPERCRDRQAWAPGVQCGAKEVADMPWIHTVPEDEADGLLRREYDAALKRAGKIFHIISIQSLRPRVLRASIALYQALMIEEGELPRWTRELLAVVVSRTNECHY